MQLGILTNLIILSKSVSRECRALMFGITCAFGALGAILGLTLGQLLHDCLNHDSLFIAEILLCIAFILIYFCLGGKNQFLGKKVGATMISAVAPQVAIERSESLIQ